MTFIASWILIYALLNKGLIQAESKTQVMTFEEYRRKEGSKSRGWFYRRKKATFFCLCRNEDLLDLTMTLSTLEKSFNLQYQYPYIFVNDKPFTKHFKRTVKTLINRSSKAEIKFGLVPPEHWDMPKNIDMEMAEASWKDFAKRGVIYGDSKSYRQMCRYYSGFFFDHPLLKDFDYYWRIEPGVSFLCNIPFDPFQELSQAKKKYGFNIIFKELPETIPTLWRTVQEYSEKQLRKVGNLIDYFKDSDGNYNYCHFWDNFEIADLSFFRSAEYRNFFKYLDDSGGFFYERWGDAPVHSLAVGLLLRKKDVMYFDLIGYQHSGFRNCPVDPLYRAAQQCSCTPNQQGETSQKECQLRWSEFPSDDEDTTN